MSKEDNKIPAANWNYPTSVWFGPGRISELVQACQQLHINKPLLVTDQGLVGLPFISDTKNRLKKAGLAVEIFSEIKPNPTEENISAGVKAYHQGQHDGVIAFGGGSSLDAGKAIALMVGQTLPLWDFEDVGDNWTKVEPQGIAPVIAIPTTAGTGSEVGRASVICDQQADLKKIIFHPKMLPQIVIADPALTLGLNPEITAATGMDALSHNLEALCAPGYHPLAEGIALEGIRLIHHNLKRAVDDGADMEARAHMLSASLMGATAFQKGLGGMHALAHPLGAKFDAHHGLLNAVLMPYVLSYNRRVIHEAILRIADVLRLPDKSVDGFITWVIQLRRDIGIPHTLDRIKNLELNKGHIKELAAKAVLDPSNAGNPRSMTADSYESILQHAISGEL